MRRLNIFVDETGDFGFNKNSSELYGVSFVFHEQKDNISYEINKLNERLKTIGYSNMIHTANLILNRENYRYLDTKTRKGIFNALYQFSWRIKVKYHSIFVNEKFHNNKMKLRKELLKQLELFINNDINYFNKFDKVILYYDNGQESLGNILDFVLSKLNGYFHISNFYHTEKRLFQVADMLTFIDKYDYKFKNKLTISKNEKFFFETFGLKNILKALSNKRIK